MNGTVPRVRTDATLGMMRYTHAWYIHTHAFIFNLDGLQLQRYVLTCVFVLCPSSLLSQKQRYMAALLRKQPRTWQTGGR